MLIVTPWAWRMTSIHWDLSLREQTYMQLQMHCGFPLVMEGGNQMIFRLVKFLFPVHVSLL